MPEITTEVAADIETLLNLLAFLPDPAAEENRAWWELFAEYEADRGTREKSDAHYIVNKLVGHWSASTWWHARCLAMYTLMFFDSPTDDMGDLISNKLDPYYSGHRYIDSLCAVAWRIYVATEGTHRRSERVRKSADQ